MKRGGATKPLHSWKVNFPGARVLCCLLLAVYALAIVHPALGICEKANHACATHHHHEDPQRSEEDTCPFCKFLERPVTTPTAVLLPLVPDPIDASAMPCLVPVLQSHFRVGQSRAPPEKAFPGQLASTLEM
ncbi:MAG: DUF2946 family protein [Candidatus Hydrogenedentes bacterium]|nr:DUF2946 family protein [Candidatus Hydrogenedentota bacterium]